MTVQVKASDTLEAGIEAIKEASIQDYNQWVNAGHHWVSNSIYAEQEQKEFAEHWKITEGKKYIKLIRTPHNQQIVFCFIVATEGDKKFRKGDVLKPDGWKTPARNKARGNIFDGDFSMKWTGPLYL